MGNLWQRIKETFFKWSKEFMFWFSLLGLLVTIVGYLIKEKLFDDLGDKLKNGLIESDDLQIIGIFCSILLLVFLTLIIILIYFTIRLINKNKKIKSIGQANQKLTSELKKNNDYIKNVEYIEKIIKKKLTGNYGNLGNYLDKYLSDNLTVLPLKYEYIKLIGDSKLITLFSKTNISLKDKKGKVAHFKKRMHVIPLEKDKKDVHYKAHFEPQTKVFNVLINDKPVSGQKLRNHLKKENNQVLLEFNPIKHSFKQYQLDKSSLEMNVNNCFTAKKEFWISEWSKYPISFDEVTINLKAAPTHHQVYIWDHKGKRWIQSNPNYAIMINDGNKRVGSNYPITYLLNFQDVFLDGNKEPKFKIEWII